MNLEWDFLGHFQSERPSVYVIQSAGMKDKLLLRNVDHFLGDNFCKTNTKYAKFLEEFYEIK